MFIKEIKEYLIKNSYCFNSIEIKQITDPAFLESKMVAQSIVVEDFSINYRDKLVSCIAEGIIDAFTKSNKSKCDLYLLPSLASIYSESFDIVTARICFTFN